MEKLKKNIFQLSFMISIPIVNIFYGILNNSSRGVYNLTTNIDKATPFLRVFIIPYVIWYPYIFFILVYLCLNNKKVYYKTLFCLNIGFIASYVIFYLFQTVVVRPNLVQGDILTKLVHVVYKNDKPFNCFPSLHVLTTYFVMKGINEIDANKKIKILTGVIGSLIILSTLFVKQHVIMDVVFAIILGGIILRCVSVIFPKGIDEWTKKLFSNLFMKNKFEN